MPLQQYEWINRQEVLTFEEITRLAKIFVGLGVNKIRLTGGEPLLRRNLDRLIRKLARIYGLEDLCLTTNGEFLEQEIAALYDAGLKRINVSIDTLKPDRFRELTKRGHLKTVLDGLFAAKSYGLHPIKINAVIVRGINDDEILDLVDFSREHGFSIRFIEFMDVGNSNQWKSERMVSKAQILQIIHQKYPLKEIGRVQGNAPSVDYQYAEGSGDLGIIASVTEPFCFGCTRARLTADGSLVTCLFSHSGCDLKALMRGGASDKQLVETISSVWSGRADRYSEERLHAMQSSQGYEPGSRKKIEMITLGG